MTIYTGASLWNESSHLQVHILNPRWQPSDAAHETRPPERGKQESSIGAEVYQSAGPARLPQHRRQLLYRKSNVRIQYGQECAFPECLCFQTRPRPFTDSGENARGTWVAGPRVSLLPPLDAGSQWYLPLEVVQLVHKSEVYVFSVVQTFNKEYTQFRKKRNVNFKMRLKHKWNIVVSFEIQVCVMFDILCKCLHSLTVREIRDKHPCLHWLHELLTLTIVDTNSRTRAATCRMMIPSSNSSIFQEELDINEEQSRCFRLVRHGCVVVVPTP